MFPFADPQQFSSPRPATMNALLGGACDNSPADDFSHPLVSPLHAMDARDANAALAYPRGPLASHMPHRHEQSPISPPHFLPRAPGASGAVGSTPKSGVVPGAIHLLDSKRRRTSPVMSPSLHSPAPGAEFGSPQVMHDQQHLGQYAMRNAALNQTPPTPSTQAYAFSPNLLALGIPETPTSASSMRMNSVPTVMPGGGNLSPLAHRGMRTPHGDGEQALQPGMLQQMKMGTSVPSSGIATPVFVESAPMRRANSYNAVGEWGTSESDAFFPMPTSMSPLSQGSTLPASVGRPMAPPLQRQHSEPQARTVRERLEKKAATDVWPDDVEVAFWEALRLIPKLGRRKVLVHGKPCGRNELIADYIERKTQKVRSRKQVSSHIQVLKNVKRGDPEFQQLIAEPMTEEDYYTPAGGMMYAQSLAEYSSGLLGVPLQHAETVTVSPLQNGSLSPNPGLMSPLPAAHSPGPSPRTTSIANALDNLHLPMSPRPGVPPPTVMLADLNAPTLLFPTSFSMAVSASKTDETHLYTKLDAQATTRVLQNAAPLPLLTSSAASLATFRFPRLAELRQSLHCPFLHVRVPLTLPRLDTSCPVYDQFSVALSLASTKNTPLTSVLSIYSHGKCILSMVDKLDPPRAMASCRSDNGGGPRSPQLAPAPLGDAALPADRYRWTYQAPLAADFWADFLRRNHPVHLYGAGGMEVCPSFAKDPCERAALGMAVAGVTFLQEFIASSKDHPQGPLPPSSPAGAEHSPGSKLGEVVCVIAWETECVESVDRQPGVPVVSVVEKAPPGADGAAPPATSTAEATPTATPTPAASLGLQTRPGAAAAAPPAPQEPLPRSPLLHAPAKQGHVDRLRPNTPPPMPPTLIRTQPSPLATKSPVKLERPAPTRLTFPVDQTSVSSTASTSSTSSASVVEPMSLSDAKLRPGADAASEPAHQCAWPPAHDESVELDLPLGAGRHPVKTGGSLPMLMLSANMDADSASYANALLSPHSFDTRSALHTGDTFGDPRRSPLGQPVMRSNSMSVLESHDSALSLGETPSAAVNALMDPLPSFDTHGDPGLRLGMSMPNAMSLSMQQEFMDTFLTNTGSPDTLLGAPCMSPCSTSANPPGSTDMVFSSSAPDTSLMTPL
ncbi:hypothetical protein MSPP1_002441 [Malassezia sp. CBS 17886]|nr:hypothetical protein MSPP1_002441 [Malassezia sp. CBS 17886]